MSDKLEDHRETTSDTVQPSEELERLRVAIATIVRNWFTRLFWLTTAFALVLVGIIVAAVFTGKTIESMALAASVQVAFGMIIGFVCIYIGLMMTWFGIDAAYDATVKGESGGVKGEMSLKSASPGLLFSMGGIILIAVSLYKPIVYEEAGPLRHVIGIDQDAEDEATGARPIPDGPPPYADQP